MGESREPFVVERLGDEVLVYDVATDEAHCLSAEGAAAFDAACDDVSRRQVIRRMALAGAGAIASGALVKSIAAPSPAQAQSTVTCVGAPGGTCTAGETCCGTGGVKLCCDTAAPTCCANPSGAAACCGAGLTCCIAGAAATCCNLLSSTCDPTAGCVPT
jgi:hypothetical protein